MKFSPKFLNRRVMNEDFTQVGNLTFNNGIVSNFSTASYMRIGLFNPGTKPWEMFFKINSGDITKTNPIIAPTYDLKNILLVYSSRMTFYYSYDGSTWQSISNSTTLTANTDYWVRCGYDGSYMYCDVSIDGESWMSSTIAAAGTINESYMTIGCNYARSALSGTFDTLNSWIKIDGEYWWKFYDEKYYWLLKHNTDNSSTVAFLSH